MRLGIIGTGTIVREALPLLKAPDWEVTALCGTPRSLDVIRELCLSCHIPHSFTDPEAMLREAPVDVVYVAVPNHLHFQFARQGLLAGKHILVEKPMVASLAEALELSSLARERGLFLFEAVTTLYLPNYQKVLEWLPRLGTIKMAGCQFNQYSRRYDAFCRGEILPVFDPAKAGGALMDLGVYNLHYLLGLFGPPESALYRPNMERGVDTSGVAILSYPGFRAYSVAAKDCSGPSQCVIQGTDGYLVEEAPANICGPVTLRLRDGTVDTFDAPPLHRMEPEFAFFARELAGGDPAQCYRQLDKSLAVARVITDIHPSI